MDIENLNKTQIILLTLLVSFVTSIATGIATVSLMEKAPTDVTRVISRIIEKPIETITSNNTPIVEERTVFVNEGEQIATAVQKLERSLLRLYTLSNKDTLTFQGFGIIISGDGTMLTDPRIAEERRKYVGILSDGTRLNATPSEAKDETGLFHLSVVEGSLPVLTPATFAPFDAIVLGQTVIAVGGETSTRITPGVVAELFPPEISQDSSRLQATIDASGIVLGTPLIDLSGRVIGMPENLGSNVFLSLKESSS